MQLDGGYPQRDGALDLPPVGVNEEREANAGVAERSNRRFEALGVGEEVEPALGGDFLALLWDNRDLVRAQSERDRRHLRGGGHFEVQRGTDDAGQRIDVRILDVAAIFPQVHGDAICAGVLTNLRGGDRIGISRPTGLPQRGDVIDVDEEALRGHLCGHDIP
jgi:hypothetical protein